jgi:hypothetical protein
MVIGTKGVLVLFLAQMTPAGKCAMLAEGGLGEKVTI